TSDAVPGLNDLTDLLALDGRPVALDVLAESLGDLLGFEGQRHRLTCSPVSLWLGRAGSSRFRRTPGLRRGRPPRRSRSYPPTPSARRADRRPWTTRPRDARAAAW